MDALRMIASEQQALCIVGLLVMSLLLSVWAGALVGTAVECSKDWKMTAWLGQIILAVAGLMMIAMPRFGFVALLFATIVCAALVLRLKKLKCG